MLWVRVCVRICVWPVVEMWAESGRVAKASLTVDGTHCSVLSDLESRDEGGCTAHALSRGMSGCTSLRGLGINGTLKTHKSTAKSHTLHWTTKKHTQALHYAEHCKFRVAGTSLVVGGSLSKRCYSYIAGHWSCSLLVHHISTVCSSSFFSAVPFHHQKKCHHQYQKILMK